MAVVLDLLNNDPRSIGRVERPRHPEKAHRPDQPIARKPDWIRVKAPGSEKFAQTQRIVRQHGLVTVCEEAGCPNIGECWEKKHATFMIMGDTCTRACAFCNVRTGMPLALEAGEPQRVAEAVALLGLSHVVVTSVDRDDLNDGGAEHFARTILAIRAASPATTIEVLTPDFLRKEGALEAVIAARPDVFNLLASSTSAILPSKFTETLSGRSRCLVVHPINPPYLIPAAEVVPAPWTDRAVVERTAALLRGAGHAPIVMRREIDGFVMNRMQGALLEEAFRLVAEGYASVEDIDIGIREGLALRWSFMGPFETIDLNAPAGVRDYAQRYQSMYADIFPTVQWRADWTGPVIETVEAERRAALPASRLGERQAWRDRRLMALAAHKRLANRDIGR